MVRPRFIIPGGNSIHHGLNVSGSTIPAHRIVRRGALADSIVIATDASLPFEGVTLRDVLTSAVGSVQHAGRTVLEAATAIAPGQEVTAGALGKAVPAVDGDAQIVGIANTSASFDGDLIEVDFLKTARPVAFHPSQVPAIAAGFFWDSDEASGTGSAFVLPEGNAKTVANMVPATAPEAPLLVSSNGLTQLRFVNGTPDSSIRTLGPVQAGWSGDTWIAFWARFPTGSVNEQNFFLHVDRLAFGVHASFFSCAVVASPTAATRFTPAADSTAWHFYATAFRTALPAAQRLKGYIDGVEVPPTVVGSPGTTLSDPASVIGLSRQGGDTNNANIAADVEIALIVYAQGIPTDEQALATMGYKDPR